MGLLALAACELGFFEVKDFLYFGVLQMAFFVIEGTTLCDDYTGLICSIAAFFSVVQTELGEILLIFGVMGAVI